MAESFDGAGILLLPYDVAERLWFDEWWYRGEPSAGLLVEISHLTISDADALLDRLLIDHEPDPSLLTFAAALAYGRRLAGEAAQLTGRVADYPQPLAAAVVRTLGQIDHFWRWQMYRDRNDPHGLRIHYATVVTAITHMVCGLNRRWWPGPKWPAWILADLAISPPDLARRLLRLDTLAPAAAARELQQLVEDCYTLAETHLPEGEPQRLREIFRFARQPWPAPDAPADRPSVRLEVDQYTGDDGDWRFAPSRTAHWTGGHVVAPPDPEQLRALHWARQAITASAHRTQAAIGDAAASWQCAVEGVWWVSALDDLFWRLVGQQVYADARAGDDHGRIVLGLRWLRSVHLHDIRISGAGGPKKGFFGGGEHGGLFISPENRWLPSTEMGQLRGKDNEDQRTAYNELVAGAPLSRPLEQATVWFDRINSASRFPSYEAPDDPTVLSP